MVTSGKQKRRILDRGLISKLVLKRVGYLAREQTAERDDWGGVGEGQTLPQKFRIGVLNLRVYTHFEELGA